MNGENAVGHQESPVDEAAGHRNPIGLLVRIVVSVALLAGLLYLLPFRQVVAAIRQVPPALWAVGFVVFLLGHVVAALKWRLLIPSSVEVSAGAVVRAHFGGLAANLFLPGLIGGDVVRAAWLGRSVGGWEGVAVAGLVDRLLDMVALLLLASAGVLWLVEPSVVFGRLLLVGLGLVGAAVIIIWIVAARLEGAPAGSRGAKIAAAVGALRARPWRAVAALCLSVAVQTTFVAITARFGLAVGLGVGMEAWMAAWPLAKIAAIVPVTFAGLGTREAALVALMRTIGADPGRVAAAALLWTSVLICGALTGGLLAWAAGRPRAV